MNGRGVLPPSLRRTPLFPLYAALGARVVAFRGWALPVQFSGIIEEHQAVRRKAGLFDISHLGAIEIAGRDALALVQRLTTNDAAALTVGQLQYSALCRPDGGLLDDITVFGLAADRFLLCVNAANTEKDHRWLLDHAEGDLRVENRSDETAILALQGPAAERILAPLTPPGIPGLSSYHFVEGDVAGRRAIVSRTGYTGEDGFEIFVRDADAPDVWEAILAAGRPHGLLPAGLGARDTLRLEMGYPLYGNEIDETTEPLEGGLGRVTKLDKGDFIGREAILRRRESGSHRKLVGFELREPGIARRLQAIFAGGEQVGAVTSGTFSPSLRRAIGMGYVPEAFASPGTPLALEVRGARLRAEVVKTPFYKGGSIKRSGAAVSRR